MPPPPTLFLLESDLPLASVLANALQSIMDSLPYLRRLTISTHDTFTSAATQIL